MTNQQIAARFASGKYRDGQGNSKRSITIYGDTIRSYGSHFPVATVDREAKTFVFNHSKYSRTTSRHQGLIYHALIKAGYTESTTHEYRYHYPASNPHCPTIALLPKQ